jgi:hypothetical protein
MREWIGRLILALVTGYTLGACLIALLAPKCGVCLKTALFTARLIGKGRRLNVCWQCRKKLKRNGMIRPRGRPRRRIRH